MIKVYQRIWVLSFVVTTMLFMIPLEAMCFGDPTERPRTETEPTDKISFREKKRILVLNSYHEGYLWADRTMLGIKERFSSYDNVELFIEYMDTKRYSDSTYFSILADAYELKFQFHTFDAILASDDNALNFLLKYHDRLFHGIPVVFSGINDFQPDRLEGRQYFTGITEHYDEKGTLELILKLHPDTKQILYITDNTYTGEAFKRRIKQQEQYFSDKITIEYLHNLTPEEIQLKLQNAKEHSIVLWGSYLRTPDWEALTLQEGVNLILKNTDLPVYCIFDIVGTGVIGGKITDAMYQGQTAASMVIRIITNNDNPANIEVVKSPVVYKFDYTALEAQSIDLEELPEGCIIVNKPFSVYQHYKKQINFIIGLIIFLFIIISVLTFLNRKLVQAENELLNKNSELHKKTKLLSDTNIKLEAAMDKAQESDKLKTTFLANLSHEIRTPMNGILGFAALLKKENITSANRQKYLNIILQSGDRMLTIINDLIDISKIESGQVTLNNAEVHIAELCQQAYDFFHPIAEEKNLKLKYLPNGQATNITAFTDKGKLTQILYNLIKNAIKFTKSGTITFGYGISEDNIEFFVEDTGPGIPADYQSIIFDRFRQIDGSTSREEEGSGLGLSISKAFVEMMGGNIYVISEEGKGAKFIFYIPLKK